MSGIMFPNLSMNVSFASLFVEFIADIILNIPARSPNIGTFPTNDSIGAIPLRTGFITAIAFPMMALTSKFISSGSSNGGSAIPSIMSSMFFIWFILSSTLSGISAIA